MTSKLLSIRLLTRRFSTINFNPNPSNNLRTFSSLRNSTHRAARAASGQAKSLIEDEAELDSWVSDLKTDTFRLGLSGSEDDEDFDKKKTSKKTNWDSDDRRSFKKSDRDRGDKSSFGKRDRNLDDERNFRRTAGDSLNGFKDRKPGSGFSEHRRDIGGLDRKFRGSNAKHGEEEVMNRGNKFDGRKSSSNRSSFNLNIYDSNQTRRGGNQNKFMEKRSRGSVANNRYNSDSEEEEEDMEEFLSMQKGPKITSMKKGGRSAESSYKQGRGSIDETSEEEEEEEEDDEIDGSEDDNELHGSDKEQEDDSDGDNELYGFDDKKKGSTKDTLLKSGSKDKEGEMRRSLDGDKDSYLSNTRFDECSISPLTLKGIKAAGYERMTLVQEATLPIILKGKDVLAKAKTGTGKTVAFLLPAIEIVSKLPPVDRDQKKPPINVLVICPTRELANQAATEANALLKFYPSIGVQCVIGGTRLALEQKRMQTNPCQILVATPGRLRDHIENTPNFGTRLMGVKVLVLDEADRLLDMGFRKDIEKIVAAVPKQRQTLLFSATVADEVRQICYIAMKRDHEFVNTVVEGSEETHSQVEQMHLIAPLEKQLPILYGLLKDHIAEEVDYKVIVFCTTAMSTRLVADLLSELRLNTREIHSRKPQSYRTRVSKEFKESKGIILVSSDVSARGVDYPDVTLVIQVGVPADREQYIHRLGRTGRKGKEGKGVLLLAPWEEAFLSTIKDLPITKSPAPLIDPDTVKKVERALGNVEMKNKESAYQAWLGYYNSNKMVGRDKYKLVLLANEFSRSLGLENPPAVPKIVLRKMGLTNVPGLRVK